MSKKSIVLIGFMGVGKTTIGNELARKLQWELIDTDTEIEEIYQMKTVDIFKIHGEEKFRKTEKELVSQAAKQKNKIISVGGGAFMQEENRKECMEHATVVFLDLSWKYWKNRVSILIDTRPILQNKSLEEMKELFYDRQTIYQDHHVRIKLDDLSVPGAVEAIIDELEL